MTQPTYAPLSFFDEVRPARTLHPPRRWYRKRPSELDLPYDYPVGKPFGAPGPDQGYAWKLAEAFRERLVVEAGENPSDVLAGCVAIASERAGIHGRAPHSGDIEVALALWGYLDKAPSDLVEYRRDLFRGVSHDYWRLRELVAKVPLATLRLSVKEVVSGSAQWKQLLSVK
ncbi:MAG: hypothetical protein M1131_06255 [Actinobacteria bacterium]|jgi:hypothetical protein|nr:hypothetical protein [Actinomycetota bacterium]MCL6095901.1 hypothetical protein [Actinomycetota bacterium]